MTNASSLYMTKLAGKKTIFNNLSKLVLIELMFTSTTWPQWFTLTNKVTHLQIGTCTKSFLITLKMLNVT